MASGLRSLVQIALVKSGAAATAMKPDKKSRKGGPKAAWKKKRPVSKSHRDKAQIEQFQNEYDQVRNLD